MGKSKTKYTKELKIGAVKLVKEQGYSQAEAARNLGIEAKSLSRWIKEMSCQNEPGKVMQVNVR
jgi:transposase